MFKAKYLTTSITNKDTPEMEHVERLFVLVYKVIVAIRICKHY